MVGMALNYWDNLLSLCIPPFLRWWPLWFFHNGLSRKWSWTRTISWGWWFDISTLGCFSSRWLFLPKWLSLWKSSSRPQSSALLHVRIISLYEIDWLKQGHMASSFSPRFSRGQCCLLPRSSWINSGVFGARSPVQNLSTGPPVGTGRQVVPPWQSDF